MRAARFTRARGPATRNDFRERGKIMVGVLLVQNVAKVGFF